MALISANSIGFSPPQNGCQLSGLISLNARKMRITSQNAASACNQIRDEEARRREGEEWRGGGGEGGWRGGWGVGARSACSGSRCAEPPRLSEENRTTNKY